FYCCPVEGCPRGPDRPFSQFSLKHKCSKCSNSDGTKWDLKRHAEDCGKTFQCTCGCPYAKHRDPPSKERKMDNCLHNQKLSRKTVESPSSQPIPRPDAPELETSEIKLVASFEDSCSSNAKQQTLPAAPRYPQKLLLPKPKVALVKPPVMQFFPVPVSMPTADSSAQPVVLGVDHQGSALSAMYLLPLSIGTLILSLDSEACSLRESLPLSKVVNPVAVEPISTGVQVNLGKSSFSPLLEEEMATHSITDLSYTRPQFMPSAQLASPDSSVSSYSQTDLTFGCQVSLPISVTSSIIAQTDPFIDASFQPGGIFRETQTSRMQTVMCGDIFERVHSSYGVSTDNIISSSLVAETVTHDLLSQNHPKTLTQVLRNLHQLYISVHRIPVLESLDIETQTDFFLADSSARPKFILKHSSFSLSADSPDTQTQTDRLSTAKNLPALESKVQLNRAETHTMNSGFKTLGSLFFTSNETQTATQTGRSGLEHSGISVQLC
ncbi:hypothetical protein FD754_013981, partial [Muntiacus muntjak]